MEMEWCGREVEGWETPTRAECRIPSVFPCPPPPPRKKPVVFRGRRDPPKDGYFQPPDVLEELFSPAPRWEGASVA